MSNNNDSQMGLSRYLSPLEVWALSFGCAVGWGAFVMPGTTFLPIAGPIGAAIGMIAGTLLMLIIGMNYHFLMNKYPDAGGTLTYSIRAFGYDHGLLSAWFLMLVYIAIMWANATASVLIVRNLFGPVLQWGFHYEIAGYHVYCGEVLLTLAVIAVCGVICMHSKRLAIVFQTVLAVVLVGGVLVCAIFILGRHGGLSALAPAYAPNGKSAFRQVAQIVLLAPWAYVGFESISNSTHEFKFSPKKSIWIMLAALLAGVGCYVLLVCIAASDVPAGYASWVEYIADIDNLDGLAGLPTFYAALLFVIFFTSMLWFRATTLSTTERVLDDLGRYNAEELVQHGVNLDDTESADAESYRQQKMDDVTRSLTRNSWAQMAVIVIALLIMFDIYRTIMRREKRMEAQKMQAEVAYEKAQSINVIYAHIAQAFSANCSQVYYVDLDTDEYNSFVSGAEAGEEAVETHGENFFGASRKNAQSLIYAEDLDRFNLAFTKDHILREVEENGAFTLSYRLMMDGAPVRTNLKATRAQGNDSHHLVIDVSSDDLVNARNELTGLRMEEALHTLGKVLLQEHPEGWCLIALDLEHFRLFNEWYGRESGDELLAQIGAHLARVEAETEGLACYLGQDDFVLFAPYDEEGVQRLFRDVHEYIMEHGTSVGFMPAIGLCLADGDVSINEMFDRALQASQHAKENYHQRIRVFEESMFRKTEQDYKILSDFQQAISNKELFIMLQPQCEIKTGKAVGAESLVRWKKADGTMVSPGVFVPVLEQYGFVTDLDQFVWEEVCRWTSLRSRSPSPPMSVTARWQTRWSACARRASSC